MKSTKWALMALVLAVSTPFIAAQAPAAPAQRAAPSQDDLIAKRDAKLKVPFLNRKDVTWFTDYDKAREEAKKTGKLLFAYFTRSYAR